MKIAFYSLFISLLISSACTARDKDNAPAPNDSADTPPAAGQVTDDSQAGAMPVGKTPSENGLFMVAVRWSPNLEAGTLENTAKVYFNSADGQPLAATLKKFSLFMVSMGHGSIKEKEMSFTALEASQWQVDRIYFSMPGPFASWAVDIEAEVNGQLDKARVSIDHEVL